jgi:hypothetical protein
MSRLEKGEETAVVRECVQVRMRIWNLELGGCGAEREDAS